MALVVSSRRGWVHVMEVVIAITLMSAALLYMLGGQTTASSSSVDLTTYHDVIFQELLFNESLREFIILNDSVALDDFAASLVPLSVGHSVDICEVGITCGSAADGITVFTDSRLFVGTVDAYTPKNVVVRLWEN